MSRYFVEIIAPLDSVGDDATFANMEIHLAPDQEARLAALAASAGRSPDDIVQEAVAQWAERRAQRQVPEAKHTPAEAAARILELRKGNFLPEDETIKDLIRYGRA